MSDKFKNTLRAAIKLMRSNLSTDYRIKASQQICKRIQSLEHYRHAKRIALYCAVNNEVGLNFLWSSAPRQGKFCYFPVLNDDATLTFLPATPATPFKKNTFGIPEPDVSLDEAIDVSELDMLILPLVAFDKACTRLGMGAGCYDRTLGIQKHGVLFGVGYNFQLQDFIAPQIWDVPLDGVVTPKCVYWRD